MIPKTRDLRIVSTRPLITPAELQSELPLSGEASRSVSQSRRQINEILTGKDDRLLVIAGPCSIHDPRAALDYGKRLARAARRWGDDLLLVMRVYFEKPRTVDGWKGLINDPRLDGSFAINDGLRLARKLLLDLAKVGMPSATEFLDTVFGQYFAEIVAWGCIGARTIESQVHRELASGLSMPVGFKNRTDGDVQVAIEAMLAARRRHWFPSLLENGQPAILGTRGNRQTHLILRGGSVSGPNYSAEAVAGVVRRLRAARLPARLMVDCSHGNSEKNFSRQAEVARTVAGQVAQGSTRIIGVMLESHLIEGRQDADSTRPLEYGKSITDACLGWRETQIVLRHLAAAVRKRRDARTLSTA